MPNLLNTAIERHQAGDLAAAAGLYQQLLAREPRNAAALHLLGVLHLQQGDHQRAVEMINVAVAIEPAVAVFHANLAEAYRVLGQFQRAVDCSRIALQLAPDNFEALCNYGSALQSLGKPAEAAEQIRRALTLRPDAAGAHYNLGIVLRELGEMDEALSHLRRAVELAPDLGPARSCLAQMLLDRGEAEASLPHFQEAVRLLPNQSQLFYNFGDALGTVGRLKGARLAYLEAIRLQPNFAAARWQLALALQKQGELAQALSWLKQAVELEPRVAAFWSRLAKLYEVLNEFALATSAWQHVVELEPARADAHVDLGRMLQASGRLGEAAEQFRLALGLQADLAVAELNLGGVHEELGEAEAAESAFRRALALRPEYALAQARLATLLRDKLPVADRDSLEKRLADPQLDDTNRSHLLFALGQVLDAQGEYRRAADCFRQANALALEWSKRRRREHDPAKHERFVDRILQAFGPDVFARVAGAGSRSRRPVFVFGLPHSGTTLVEQILASHPQVRGAGELLLVGKSFDAIPTVLGRAEGPLDCIAHLDTGAIKILADQHLEWLSALGQGGAERIIDKLPANYRHLGLLAVMFPNATLIHCRRDLRDTALSCWMTDFHGIPWANDPAHLASRIRQYQRLMEHWRSMLPSTITIHDVDYEEVVGNLEGTARRLISACGLDWDAACLEFDRTTERPTSTASVNQIRQPIYPYPIAQWKHYKDELSDLFSQLSAD